MSQFSFTAQPGFTRDVDLDPVPLAEAEALLYESGNGLSPEWSLTPPKMGWWGVTWVQKNRLAALREPQNWGTVVSNFSDKFIPNGTSKHMVSLGHAKILREAMGDAAPKEDGVKAFIRDFSPIQDISTELAILEFKDAAWNGEAATEEWLKNPDHLSAIENVRQYTGRDIVTELESSNNMNHFMAVQSLLLNEARSAQNAEYWERQSGIPSMVGSRITSGVFNYALQDVTTALSLGVPATPVGAGLTRAGAAVAQTGRVGQAASRALTAAPAFHAGLASKVGQRGAVAIEFGASGGIMNAAEQRAKIEASEVYFNSPENQIQWSWAEAGLATGITAAFGFAAGGNGSAAARKASVEGAGGSHLDDPVAGGWDNMAVQQRIDNTKRRIDIASSRLGVPKEEAGIYLEPGVLAETGLNHNQVAEFMEGLSESLDDGALNTEGFHTIMGQLFEDARVSHGMSQELDQAAANQVERIAYREALSRAAQDLPPTATNQEIVQEAKRLMPEELERQETILRTRADRAKSRFNPDAEDVPTVSRQAVINSQPEGMDREVARSLVSLEDDDYVEIFVPVRHIDTDEMSRDAINMENVEAFSKQAAETAPPVTTGTATGGARLDIVDGRHRTLAAILRARKAGTNPLDAPVKAYVPRRWAESRGLIRRGQAKQASELKFLKDELTALMRAASRRNLTDAEFDYLGTLSGKLEGMGEKNPLEGFAISRTRRYEDGSLFNPNRPIGSKAPLVRAVNKIRQETQALRELEEDAIAGRVDPKDIKNARARLKRAKTNLRKHLPEPVEDTRPTVHEVKKETVTKIHRGPKEKFEALDKLSKTREVSESGFIEDGNAIASALKSSGLLNLVRKIVYSGTGISQTQRSAFGMVRAVGHEFDSRKLRIGDLDPNESTLHETVESMQLEVSRKLVKLDDQYKALEDKGKFGPVWRLMNHRNARKTFDQDVIRHMDPTDYTSSDADAKNIAESILETLKEINDIAVRHDWADKGVEFPQRWSSAQVARDPQGFRRAVIETLSDRWRDSEDASLDVLANAGLISRVEFDRGVRFETLDGIPLEGAIKKHDLNAFGLTEEEYLDLIPSAAEDMSRRLRDSINGQASWEKGPNNRLILKVRHGMSDDIKDYRRRLPSDPRMEAYLDWDLMNTAGNWLSSTGFKVLNDDRHSRLMGIPGLRMEDTLDWLETQSKTIDDPRAWEAGIESLREKLYFVEGRLPNMVDQNDGLGEWLGDFFSSMAGVAYGSGIAPAILATEVSVGSMLRIYGVDDLVKRPMQLLLAGLPTSARREMLQTTGLATRQFQQTTLRRLTNDSIYSDGRQYHWLPKMMEPFFQVFEDIKARNLNSIPNGMRATTNAIMQGTGFDWAERFAQIMHVQTQMDEFGRFFTAAERMATALRDNSDRLARIRSEEGDAAFQKAWKGLARQSGFGGSWHVAAKYQKKGLLTPEKMAVLRQGAEDTNSLRDKGMFRTFDLSEAMRYVAPDSETQDLYDEAIKGFNDLTVEQIKKFVSEASAMQTPTGSTSRTWRGRMGLVMTSWSRSFADNVILDTAQMPMRSAFGVMGGYLAGETMTQVLRELWKGREPEEIMADLQDDPDNFIARAVARMPLTGAWSSLQMPLADALTRNERPFRVQVGRSAGTGATSDALNLVNNTIYAARTGDVNPSIWRTAAKFTPGYRSAPATVILGLGVQAGLWDYSDLPGAERGRYGPRGRVKPLDPKELMQDNHLGMAWENQHEAVDFGDIFETMKP